MFPFFLKVQNFNPPLCKTNIFPFLFFLKENFDFVNPLEKIIALIYNLFNSS